MGAAAYDSYERYTVTKFGEKKIFFPAGLLLKVNKSASKSNWTQKIPSGSSGQFMCPLWTKKCNEI